MLGVWALTLSVRSVGQDATPEPTRSTTAGVYSATQAQAGQAIFESTCLGGCHNMASHKGIVFKQHFDGRVVWDLYSVILDNMPKDDPGSLTPADAAGLVAYLLKLNGVPEGKIDLPVDPAELKRIKMNLPK